MAFEFEEIALAKKSKNGDELLELASSSFVDVREAVARNVHTPAGALKLLSQDKSKSIQDLANARLNSEDPAAAGLVDEYQEVIDFDEEITLYFSTLQNDPTIKIKKSLGLVYGSSSKMALGVNTQATRLNKAMHVAMLDAQYFAKTLGANAVIGVQISANSSQGASATLMGSSEGIVVVGTAVITE